MAERAETLCHVGAFLWLPEPVVGCPAPLWWGEPAGAGGAVALGQCQLCECVLWGRGGGYRNWQ